METRIALIFTDLVCFNL